MRAKENKSVTVIDQPTTEDRFEVANYVNALADFIRVCDTPMTISLQGDWGTGKTSFMKMVQEKLADTTIPIEFNVWQYSQFNMEEQLPFLLLERLTDKITSGTDNNTRLVKILRSVFKHMIDIAAAAASGGNVKIDWDAMQDRINALNELHVQLEQAICDRVSAEKGKDRVVVYIDDLDRLQPERAVELLEVLKNFVDCAHCVFVLAVDYAVVVQGVHKKYGGDISEEKGRNFFDKIIQLPFRMPVERYHIEDYVAELMGWDTDHGSIQEYVDMIRHTIGPNPRTIKRTVNYFSVIDRVAALSKSYDKDDDAVRRIKQKILFCLICIQLSYEDLYDHITAHKDDPVKLIHSLQSLAKEHNDWGENKAGAAAIFVRLAEALSDSGTNPQALRDILDYSSVTSAGPADKPARAQTIYYVRLENKNGDIQNACFFSNGNGYRGMRAFGDVLVQQILHQFHGDINGLNRAARAFSLAPADRQVCTLSCIAEGDKIYKITWRSFVTSDTMDTLIQDFSLQQYVSLDAADPAPDAISMDASWLHDALEKSKGGLYIYK